jgi:hypothetical protein
MIFIDNAVRYTPPGGSVNSRLGRTTASVVLRSATQGLDLLQRIISGSSSAFTASTPHEPLAMGAPALASQSLEIYWTGTAAE